MGFVFGVAMFCSSNCFLDSIDVFGIKKWPIGPGCNRRSLEEYTRNRRCKLNPLPAFNQNGRLLVPNEYSTELKGSLVAMQVAFFHTFDATRNIGLMHAEVDHIEIIRSPLRFEKSFTSVRMPYEQYEANIYSRR